jgi:hypothetical protein
MAFDPQMFGSGLGGVLGGLFGDSGKPYDKAMEQYQNYFNQGKQTQQPFYDAGTQGIKGYQDWLNQQKNPTEFINKMMGDYQESPYAHQLQQQAMNAGNNAASASGMMGSSALMQQQQQNAGTIANQDMNQWLQNVLGINTQYGQGQNNLMNTGQTSANALTDMMNNMGKNMGEQSYNKEAAKQNNFWNTAGGVGSMIGSFL